MKGGATREQAIEQLAASKAATEEKEDTKIAPQAPAAPTIIQTILDSLLRRLMEEEEARKAAGLTAFKATGNPLADGFRKMLEKKMMETFKQEMRAKELEDLENRKQMANQIAEKEAYLQEQTRIMQEKHRIEMQTIIEARDHALEQAKIAVTKISHDEAKKAGIAVEEGKAE